MTRSTAVELAVLVVLVAANVLLWRSLAREWRR